MSSIVPPLDRIPKLPGQAVSQVITRLNTQTDRLLDSAIKTVQDSNKLSENAKCDDPRVKQVKDQLEDIQKQITQIQESIPIIQRTANSLKSVIGASVAIKNTIAIAQLSNPVTAPLFIAQQLTAIQDATIVNAIESLNQFNTLPDTLTSKLDTIVNPLLTSISKISNICNGDVDALVLPGDASNLLSQSDIDELNDLVPTEFYTELNVSDDDITNRAAIIQQLVEQQTNILQSLQEAPSKVYQESGIPNPDLGKSGDYYIDIDTQTIYGPKPSQNSWT
jgi:uncharacterized membrane protein YdfJ with MMPL/SSD domain